MAIRSRVSVVALFLTIFVALGASAQKIDHIIFFGDSLSDAGNHFIATHQVTTVPFTLGPPTASYLAGWFHFSNGQTWAEQMADSLHLYTSGAPSLLLPGVFTDYAVGRARARAGAVEFPQFDLSTQVGKFLVDFHGKVPRNSLVVVRIGANDIDDAVNALSSDPTGQTSVAIITAAVTAIQNNIVALYGAGARMFVIPNIPDLGLTPYVEFLGANVDPSIPVIASLFSGFFDNAIAQLAGGLPFLLPPDPVHPLQFVKLFDVNTLLHQVLASPAAYGLSDVTDRCTVPNVITGAFCSTPNTYLYWDAFHPTTAGHHVLATAAMQLLPAQ